MVDSHCHLADEAFVEDVESVVRRAHAAGVRHALCIVDALEAVERARFETLAPSWPELRSATGVHPHRAGHFAGRPDDAAAPIREAIARDTRLRAVGEIGLDYHYDYSRPAVQREVFAAQVALAREVRLPIVIHTREADGDTLDVLRVVGGGAVPGVFHCFSGDVALARAALDLGFYVSFSGIVTFPKATAIHEAARFVPDDRLLAETDCPYLAPVPFRGKRNEPARVINVALRLGELRGTPSADISNLVVTNYHSLFAP